MLTNKGCNYIFGIFIDTVAVDDQEHKERHRHWMEGYMRYSFLKSGREKPLIQWLGSQVEMPVSHTQVPTFAAPFWLLSIASC